MNTLSLVAGGMLFALAQASFAQTGFQNGGFDSPGLPNGVPQHTMEVGSTFLTGWTTTPGVDGTYNMGVLYERYYIFSGPIPERYPIGYGVQLGYFLHHLGIQQTFSTDPNTQYMVSFLFGISPLNGPETGVLRVSAGDTTTDFETAPRGGIDSVNWQRQSLMFNSDGSGATTLWFGNVSGAVSIDQITVSVVPEPGVWALLGLGAFVTALVTKRRGDCKACRRSIS